MGDDEGHEPLTLLHQAMAFEPTVSPTHSPLEANEILGTFGG